MPEIIYNRATSIYILTVTTKSKETTLCRLIQNCPVELTGSGGATDYVFIRFRAAGDVAARDIAQAAAGDRAYRLFTGYGVNQREVA